MYICIRSSLKMKKPILIFFIIFLQIFVVAQNTIIMEKENGVYTVPCKVNGLPLKFIFDTGASDVSISLTEAMFMLKNGFLKKEDIGEIVYFSIANGDVAKGTKLNLREISFGGLLLQNVEASIVHESSAPLLLGQSVIGKLGKILLDGNKLTILTNGLNSYDYEVENSLITSNVGATNSTIENLRHSLLTNPTDTNIIFKLANNYQNIKNWNGAISAWTRMCKLIPEWAPSYYSIAYCFQNLGNDQQALIYYEKYITKVKPNEISEHKVTLSYAYFAISYLSKNSNKQKAIQYIKKSLQLNPNFKDAVSLEKFLTN